MYSYIAKFYELFLLDNESVVLSRDVNFFKHENDKINEDISIKKNFMIYISHCQ